MAQAALKICEICAGGPGSKFCLDCEQLFCDNCKSLHTRQKGTAKHKFVDSTEVKQEVKSQCRDHNEDLVFLCSPCNMAICTACVVGKHKGHDLSRVSDEIINLQRDNKEKLLSRSELVNKKIEQLEKSLIQLDTNEASAVKQVTEEGSRIKAMIDRHVERIISDLRSKTGSEKEKIDKMISDAKIVQKKMKDLEQRHLELQKNRNDAGLMAKLQSLNNDITKIEVVSVSSYPSVLYKTKLATEKDAETLMGCFILSELKLETGTIPLRSHNPDICEQKMTPEEYSAQYQQREEYYEEYQLYKKNY